MTLQARTIAAPVLGALALLVAPSVVSAQGRPLLAPLGAGATPEDDAGYVLAMGDVNGDGHLDALRGGWGDGRALMLGRGDGSFRASPAALPVVTTIAPPSFPMDGIRALRFGDVDGDGDLDAFVATGWWWQFRNQDRLWLNDGAGGFSDASSSLPQLQSSTACLVLADLDGDGDLDVFGGGDVGSSDYLWLGDGAGGFFDASGLLPPLDRDVFAAEAADVDGDGDLDLLLGHRDQSGGTAGPCTNTVIGLQPTLLLNDGAGRFTDATAQLPAGGLLTHAIALGDVDGDGDVDAILGNGAWITAAQRQDRLWLNDGSGTFTDATAQLPQDGEGSRSVTFADVDADGDLDLVRGGEWVWYCFPANGSRSRLWVNDGAGNFTDAPLPAYADEEDTVIAPGDVDGDGDLDLVVSKQLQARIWLNDGGGGFVDSTGPSPYVGGAPGAVALGDLDGDGDVDALFGDRLLANDGAGWFTETVAGLPAGARQADDLLLLDVDHDGDLDALHGRAQAADVLWRNDGTGAFADASAMLGGGAFSATTPSFAAGDLDGDGRDDFVKGLFDAQNELWLQSASGGFRSATAWLPAIVDDTGDVALADLDGDGDLDLWVVNVDGPDAVLLNDGSAFFTAAPAPPAFAGHQARAVVLADFDGDGDVDALVGGNSWAHASIAPTAADLLLNDGAGSFTRSSAALPMPARAVAAARAADVDLDGHLDVVFDGGPPLLWLGDGAGGFTDATALIAGNRWMPSGFAVGDVDEDGDPDVFSAQRVLRNLTRQLSPVTFPRIGRPLELLVHGAPGSSWVLAAALAPARSPLGTLGTLRLERASLVRRGAGVLDAEGRGYATYDVPAVPTLVGTTIYWQAVLQQPLGLTNMQSSTIGDL